MSKSVNLLTWGLRFSTWVCFIKQLNSRTKCYHMHFTLQTGQKFVYNRYFNNT